MTKKLLLGVALLLPLLDAAFGQYQGWQHSAPLYILTTPEGANLPSTAREEGYPVLVRLSKMVNIAKQYHLKEPLMQRLTANHCCFVLPAVPAARSVRRLEAGRRAADDALGQRRLAQKRPCPSIRGRRWSARTG